MTDKAPRIFGICLVKNEADIIQYFLEHAKRWVHRILVYDNGSDDDTWEIVKSMADDCIVPWKQSSAPFREGLRAEVFQAFRHESRAGDWWYRLDADEFPLYDPRAVLADLPAKYSVVWGAGVDYYLTEEDLAKIDFAQPIGCVLSHIRHYRFENSEVRAFRYRQRLSWDPAEPWPRHMGLVAPTRIVSRHYKYRSPMQIATRLGTRHAAVQSGFDGWWKQLPREWQKCIVSPSSCKVDDGISTLDIDLSRLPDHLDRGVKGLMKRALHATHIWP